MQWIEPPESSTGIGYYEHAKEEASRVGGPLAFRRDGGKSLGIHIPEGTAMAQAITWRLRGVPMGWSSDDLLAALRGVGIAGAIDVLDQSPGGLGWRGSLIPNARMTRPSMSCRELQRRVLSSS